MRARISRVRDRVLWTALRFSLESCIHESFPNSLHVGLKIHALSVSPNESRDDVLPVKPTMSVAIGDRWRHARHYDAVYSPVCLADWGWCSGHTAASARATTIPTET